jgi:hypothetical protein
MLRCGVGCVVGVRQNEESASAADGHRGVRQQSVQHTSVYTHCSTDLRLPRQRSGVQWGRPEAPHGVSPQRILFFAESDALLLGVVSQLVSVL